MHRFTSRKLKLTGALGALLLLLAIVPVVYGGLRWSGMDPHVKVDGVDYYLNVFVPPNQWCRVDGPIEVVFHVPEGSSYELIAEMAATADNCDVGTSTSFVEDDDLDDDEVVASVLVRSTHGKFRVIALLESGDDQTQCKGKANKEFSCGADDDD